MISSYRFDRYVTDEEIKVGDVVIYCYGDGSKQKGRRVKHFLPGCSDPDARNWNMEFGGIMIELDDGQWIGYGAADEDLEFLSRGTAG